MTRRAALVVFDWDGTILDSIPAIVGCTRTACEVVGLAPPAERRVRSVIGLGLADSLATLFPALSRDHHGRFVEAYREAWIDHYHAVAEPFDGVVETLERLAGSGVRLAVATAKSRRGLDRDFERTGLDRYFELSATGDETAPKPDPAMLEVIVAATGVGVERAIMVGDTAHDLEMARRAGMRAIAVATGALGRPELEALDPLACLDRLAELVDWLQPPSEEATPGAEPPSRGPSSPGARS